MSFIVDRHSVRPSVCLIPRVYLQLWLLQPTVRSLQHQRPMKTKRRISLTRKICTCECRNVRKKKVVASPDGRPTISSVDIYKVYANVCVCVCELVCLHTMAPVLQLALDDGVCVYSRPPLPTLLTTHMHPFLSPFFLSFSSDSA